MQPAVLQQLNFFSTGPSDLLGAQGGCTLLMRNCIVLLPPCSLCTLRLYKHFKLHFIERFWAWPCLLYSDDQYNVWENDRKNIPLYPFEDRRHDWSHHRNSARFSSEVFTGPRSWIWQLLGLQPSKHFFVWTFWLLLQLGSFPISATLILGTWIEKPNTGNSYYSLENKKLSYSNTQIFDSEEPSAPPAQPMPRHSPRRKVYSPKPLEVNVLRQKYCRNMWLD